MRSGINHSERGESGRRPFGAAAILGLACAAIALFPGGGEAAKKPKKKKQARPNIVMVMTDDQAAEQQRYMPKTNALLDQGGVNFTNNFVTYPLCCPSRSTWLTGQYPHNHGVRSNQFPSGGYAKLDKSNTLPVWLQSAGYRTAHIGKFLNGYGRTSPDTEVPPGWSEWYGSLDDPDAYIGGTYSMYGYTLNENGSVVHYGSTPDVVDPPTYQTDVYSAKAADFIRRNAPSSKPFFLSVAPLASHTEGGAPGNNNPRAAPRHEGAFASEVPPTKPSFNESDVSDKPQSIQNLNPLTPLQRQQVGDNYRARAESLLAVDDMVQNIADTLGSQGELKNTVIIFTSDNGYFHGEHRVRQGKVRLYEESIRVPLLIRGPGFPKGKNRTQPVANVDLAPTIADIADAKPQRKIDGRSLLPIAEDKLLSPGRPIGIEAFFPSDPEEDPETPPLNYTSVRTDRYIYAEYGTGESELYDLYSDPYQLTSRHADPSLAPVRAALDRLLARTANCAGGACAARPALKLKLSFDREDGCITGGVQIRLAGSDADEALQGRIYSRSRKSGVDNSGPIEGKVGAKLLSAKRKNRLTVNATLLDGRVASVTATVPRGC